ncbi:MAG TPA: ROK family protein [Candidatus Angelobacter sp.]|nr:ROK family protein [Candidatus Angelobacter sp.]
MQEFAIGVDLGGTNLRVAAIDATGSKLQTVDKRTEGTRESVIEEMTSAIRSLARRYSSSHKFLGIGVGIPGVVDLADGILRSASNLPGWDDYPVVRDLEARLAMPVMLENDANCAALGEQWVGVGQGVKDLCMLTLGTGVGGGLLVHGRPWHGVAGMAGEVGHMTVIPDGRPCGCGNRGCLEQYASASAVRRLAAEAVLRGEPTSLHQFAGLSRDFTAEAVFQAALQGDRIALQIFDTVGSALGIALANLINVLNLPLYVLGGGLTQAWDVFSPALFRELKKRSIVFRTRAQSEDQHGTPIIAPTRLGGDAGLMGAARLPMLEALRGDCCRAAV